MPLRLLPFGRDAHPLSAFTGESVIEPDVVALGPAEILEALPESPKVGLRVFIVLGEAHDHADALHPLPLLCTFPPAATPPSSVMKSRRLMGAPPQARAHIITGCARTPLCITAKLCADVADGSFPGITAPQQQQLVHLN
jgi:hypothetical protein